MSDVKSSGEIQVGRRQFVQWSALAASLGIVRPAFAQGGADLPQAAEFELEETTLASLRSAMESGKLTSRAITELYLRRIDQIDKRGPAVNAIIELNPDALSMADACDTERKAKGPRGPLHGIPVLIKDNIETADRMQTTAGSLALEGSISRQDSFVAKRLRQAGAVLLGKTNLSEWANFRSTSSSSGWSGRGSQTRNPYALDRNPSGSSSGSGVAIAANMAAIAVGTETDGSITSPASSNCLVGIKPTVGLVSRSGIIPISHTQDTAGPMARTVTDAAILLGALTGTDPRDPVTNESRGRAHTDYTKFLVADGLKGARIGVARKFFGFSDKVDKLMHVCLGVMKDRGAILVDPVELPVSDKYGDAEFLVLLFEFKAGLNRYLAALGPGAPIHSLQELIAFNKRNADREMPFFGQDILVKAQSKGTLASKAYVEALAKCRRYSRTEGIDQIVRKHRLDAIVGPTGGPAWTTDLLNGDHSSGGFTTPAAVAGYPHITVPAGFTHGLPVGLSFVGPAYSEPTLIKLAYAFEQATRFRKAPRFLPTAHLT